MSGNANPIYTRVGDMTSDGSTAMTPTLTTAAADYDGTGANNAVAFTADGTNGGFVSRLRAKAKGTNTASVLRVFINNGSDHTVASNNSFFGEQSLPSTTASNTQGTVDVDYPMNVALPPGFKIYVGLATTVSAGWVITPVAGKY